MAEAPDDRRRRAMELAYYLPPPSAKDDGDYWEKHSGSQDAYMALCQRGHTMIANRIIDGVRTDRPPTVKELYQTAARVRRAIAVVNQSQSPACMQFGQPLAGSDNNRLRDIITPYEESRFNAHFHNASDGFDRIQTLARHPADFKTAFGDAYSARLSGETQIAIRRGGLKAEAAILSRDRHNPMITLFHAQVKDRDALFAEADRHFRHILSHPRQDSDAFMRDLGAISLELFHAAPLKRGSQTATLMVLAGISKAMGVEVVPRVLKTDHFIEAELTPYAHYINEYGNGFLSPPARLERPIKPFAVDHHFMGLAAERVREHYAGIPSPLDRLTRYIRDTEDPIFQTPAMVKRMEVKDGAITGLQIHPRSQQAVLEKALEFIGHDEIIDILGLEPVKYAATHAAGARSRKASPRGR